MGCLPWTIPLIDDDRGSLAQGRVTVGSCLLSSPQVRKTIGLVTRTALFWGTAGSETVRAIPKHEL